MARRPVGTRRHPCACRTEKEVMRCQLPKRRQFEKASFSGTQNRETGKSRLQLLEMLRLVPTGAPMLHNMGCDDEKPRWLACNIDGVEEMRMMAGPVRRTVRFVAREKSWQRCASSLLFLHARHDGAPRRRRDHHLLTSQGFRTLQRESENRTRLTHGDEKTKAEIAPIAEHERAADRFGESDLDVPEPLLRKTASFAEGLRPRALRFERLALHTNCLGKRIGLCVPQSLPDGARCARLFFNTFFRAFLFRAVMDPRGIDPAARGFISLPRVTPDENAIDHARVVRQRSFQFFGRAVAHLLDERERFRQRPRTESGVPRCLTQLIKEARGWAVIGLHREAKPGWLDEKNLSFCSGRETLTHLTEAVFEAFQRSLRGASKRAVAAILARAGDGALMRGKPRFNFNPFENFRGCPSHIDAAPELIETLCNCADSHGMFSAFIVSPYIKERHVR